MKIVLASASPRRAEVLRNAGITFDTTVTNVDEARLPNESASAMVLRLAEAKAHAAAARLQGLPEPAIILGADTAVELDGNIFGKPGSAEIALQMLRQLSGKTHHVLTGVALIRLGDGAMRSAVETTAVHFAPPFDPQELGQYAANSEPLDKAGAYAIQGVAGRYIDRIEGCYFNVVGLPLSRVYRMLVELGWRPGAA